jgi:WD40 repeat protein
MIHMRRVPFLWSLCLFLAACTSAPATPVAPPTQPPLEWRQSAAPITLDNVAQVAALGRLDQPEQSNTIMTHTVSPDGTRLAALTFPSLLVYDLLTGQFVYAIGRGEATQIFFSPDKVELYAIAASGEVTVIEADTGGVLNSFIGHPAYGGIATFDSLNGWLVMAGSDGTIQVWDPFERVSLATLMAQGSSVADVAMSPDGTRVVSGSLDRRVRVWEWEAGTPLAEWDAGEADISRVAFAGDGDRVAAGTSAGVRVWSVSSGAEVAVFPLEGGAQRVLRFSPDGRYLVGGSRAGGVHVWTLGANTLLSRLPEVDGENITAHFSPDSRMLITGSVGRPISLWNLTEVTGETIGRADLPVASGEIIDVDWTDDGRLLLFMDARGSVYVWGIPGA